MPQFAYKALQLDGIAAEGIIEAANRQEAMRQVELRGLKPIRLSESAAPAGKAAAPSGKSGGLGFSLKFGQSNKITPRILENFTRLLSSLLAAGVPFSRALVIIHREAAERGSERLGVEGLDLQPALGDLLRR